MPTKKKSKPKTISAEDLYRFEFITDMRISPGGDHVAYSVQRVDKTTEKKYMNLWIVPSKGGKPKQFTYGDHVDCHPRWSPDGKEIFFISNRGSETQSQIYIIPLDGGEGRLLTNLTGTIGGFNLSNDGKKLVMEFRKKDKEQLERDKDDQKKKLGVVARHYTNLWFKLDGEGYLPDEKWHLWTVDTKSGKAMQITDDQKFEEYNSSFSPDGKKIVFYSNRTDEPELNPDHDDIYVINSDGSRMKKIPGPVGAKILPSFSPDSKWIACFCKEGEGKWYRNIRLWIVPSDGKGKAKCLTANYDFNTTNDTINDLAGAHQMRQPIWSKNGDWIYFTVSLHGNTVLKKIRVSDCHVVDLPSDDGVIGCFDFNSEQTRLAFYFGNMTHPGQIFIHDNGMKTVRQLTHHNSWIDRLDLGEIEEVWFNGSDNNKLQGWILKPPNFNPKRKYPAILEIHGGPRVQYGNLMMHEFFYLAAAGYVVFFCNPRGGQGYGEAHSKAIVNDWGNKDYTDLMKWTDFVTRKPYVDKTRVGVTGGSYGGYMTGWIVGHTNRFKAAVSQRMVSNLVSMWGSSDFNWVFQEEFGGKPPYENLANFWRQSPQKYVGNVKTPTLIIHSEMDLRCAIEQAEQFYVALKTRGIDTEMVRFPDEPHGLSRGGRTDRRIVRLKHIRRWFDKYLMGKKS